MRNPIQPTYHFFTYLFTSYWGPPQDFTGSRPSYKVDSNGGGTDLAGEMAASLAAAYLVFKDDDPFYATTLLNEAKSLYTFAETYQQTYTQQV